MKLKIVSNISKSLKEQKLERLREAIRYINNDYWDGGAVKFIYIDRTDQLAVENSRSGGNNIYTLDEALQVLEEAVQGIKDDYDNSTTLFNDQSFIKDLPSNTTAHIPTFFSSDLISRKKQ